MSGFDKRLNGQNNWHDDCENWAWIRILCAEDLRGCALTAIDQIFSIEVQLDGLLTPLSQDLSLPLVFLEAQMQSDPDFYGRYFAGIFLYLRQHKAARPWQGLLILHCRSQDLSIEAPYQSQLDTQVQRLYLEDLLPLRDSSPNLAILRLLILPDREVGTAARAILQHTQTEAEFRQRLDLVEAILVNKFPQLSVEEVRQMLDLKEANLTQTRFYQEVLQQGMQQGLQQGLQKGEAEIVLRLLTRRCGELSITQQELARSLPIEQLETLGEALLDFSGMADLEVWLQEHHS